jgi:hypothetical protein
MNGKALCLIFSENAAVLKEYNFTRLYTSKHKEKYKIVSVLWDERWVFSLKRMSSENNPTIVPLYCRQVIVLLAS